jgi:hypothetical protein
MRKKDHECILQLKSKIEAIMNERFCVSRCIGTSRTKEKVNVFSVKDLIRSSKINL